MLQDFFLMIMSTTLLAVVAEPQSYLPPNQGQAQFNNQYLPPGSHQGGPSEYNGQSFGQRRISPAQPQNRFADTNPPSTQYGNPITPLSRFGGSRNSPSARYIPSANNAGQRNGGQAVPASSPRRISPSRVPSSPFSQPGIQYSNPPVNPNRFSNQINAVRSSNRPTAQYGAARANAQNNANAQTQYGVPSGPVNRFDNSYSPSGPQSTSGASSVRLSDRFGGVLPTQYTIPFPPVNSQSDPIKQGGAARGYDGAENVPSNRFGGVQAPSSQYGAGRGQNQLRNPPANYGAPPPTYGLSDKEHMMHDDMSVPAHYEFMYEVQDVESGNDFGHMESRHDDDAHGTYYVMLPDGRKQIVEYKANLEGYMPMVRYEGSAHSDPQSHGGPY